HEPTAIHSVTPASVTTAAAGGTTAAVTTTTDAVTTAQETTTTEPVTTVPETTTKPVTTTQSVTTVPETTTEVTTTTESPSVLKGDINQDGELSLIDVVLMKQFLMKAINLTGEQTEIADMNDNGVVNVFDFIRLYNEITGIE
ncbi:MAG: dockerin type I repeat-containing protein, partial [Oscillospiraceae bacterium]|nr:dockerin type I repeat-containing protein [Oscillospiraceae bacterium]